MPDSPTTPPKADTVAEKPLELTQDEKTWGMLCHVSAIFPFGPIIVWAIKKDTMPFVADQGREASNFYLTVFIAFFAVGFVTVPLAMFAWPLAVLVHFALWAAGMGCLVLFILGGIKANTGVKHRYPFSLKLIK